MPNEILVVDDEATVCRLIEDVGTACGYDVVGLMDAQTVPAYLRAHDPALILMDLQMPRFDGIELLRRLSEERCGAQIVIASACERKVIESAQRLGAERGLNIVEVLEKPLAPKRIKEMFESLQPRPKDLTAEDLRAALDRREFLLLFQPKVRLGAQRIDGFEALIRWDHPHKGLLAPGAFLGAVEAFGLATEVSDFVIQRAFEHLVTWKRRGLKAQVAVNVPLDTLTSTSWADELQQRCRQAELDPQRITLEVTETATVEAFADVMDILTRIRLMGFRLSMDDFGAGFSSVDRLQKLPFSELKIDRAFVRHCAASPQDGAIVRALVDMAHGLGMSVVAEGVENAATASFLTGIGCDQAQGFHFCAPVHAHQVDLWMSSQAHGGD